MSGGHSRAQEASRRTRSAGPDRRAERAGPALGPDLLRRRRQGRRRRAAGRQGRARRLPRRPGQGAEGRPHPAPSPSRPPRACRCRRSCRPSPRASRAATPGRRRLRHLLRQVPVLDGRPGPASAARAIPPRPPRPSRTAAPRCSTRAAARASGPSAASRTGGAAGRSCRLGWARGSAGSHPVQPGLPGAGAAGRRRVDGRPAARRDGPDHRGDRVAGRVAADRGRDRRRGRRRDHRRQLRLPDRAPLRPPAVHAPRPLGDATPRRAGRRAAVLRPPRRQGGVPGPVRGGSADLGGLDRRHDPHAVAQLPALERARAASSGRSRSGWSATWRARRSRG